MDNETESVAESAPVTRVTLDEFCRDTSRGDRRVELLAAFHHLEAAAGRMSDEPAAYEARLLAAANRPVS